MKTKGIAIMATVIVFFCGFAVYHFSAEAHDPHWWKHVGIEEVKPHHVVSHGVVDPDAKVQRMRVSTNSNPFGAAKSVVQQNNVVARIEGVPPVRTQSDGGVKLIKDVHYHADYDVSKVVNLPYVYPPNPAFRYIPDDSPWPHTWVSMKPRIVVALNFFSDAECDKIVELARPRVARSRVVPHRDSKNQNTVDDVRTSSQTWMDTQSGPSGEMCKKILKFTGFEPKDAEALQVLKYEPGQKYNTHMDYFDPAYHGKQYSNRAVTCFFYLTDVPEGGETVFPMADGAPPVYNYTNFNIGLRVKPQKGMLVVFYDMKPDRSFDKWSLHGGAPPRNGGVKWAGTLWLRVNTP